MVALDAIARAIEFIEAHLHAPVSVAEMAEAVSYSLYYFSRMFSQTTHHTPYDYLMRRRISESARDLLRNDRKVIDVAFDYQFNTPETFSRAFRRIMGITPSQWREEASIGYRQLMPPLTSAHLEHIQRCFAPHTQRPALALESCLALCLVGAMTLARDLSQIARAWKWLLKSLPQSQNGEADVGDFYGVTQHIAGDELEWAYMAAVEAPGSLAKGRALVVKTLPPLQYVRLTHRGHVQDIGLTLDYVYHTWIPQNDFCPAQRLYLERYGENAPLLSDDESGVWDVYVPVSKARQ